MAKHLHANNDDFARCYYEDPTTVHLVISDPDEYFGQVHKVFDVPRAMHNEPGRHRYDEVMVNSPSAVFRIPEIDPTARIEPSAAQRIYPGKFECPREWVDGIAVEFEYL